MAWTASLNLICTCLPVSRPGCAQVAPKRAALKAAQDELADTMARLAEAQVGGGYQWGLIDKQALSVPHSWGTAVLLSQDAM